MTRILVPIDPEEPARTRSAIEQVVRMRRIVMAARGYGCDRIVFGRDEPGLAGRIFGSLAQQVRQHLGASGDPQVIGS